VVVVGAIREEEAVVMERERECMWRIQYEAHEAIRSVFAE